MVRVILRILKTSVQGDSKSPDSKQSVGKIFCDEWLQIVRLFTHPDKLYRNS
jgi:hypothetical protein